MMKGTILPNGYVVERLLKTGGLSHLWLAIRDEHHIIVKTFRRDPEWTEEESRQCYQYFLNEIIVLQEVDHKRVIKPLGTYYTPDELCILLPYISGEDLRSWMDAFPPPRPLEHFWKIAATTADGLRYIHSKGIIHRDLAPRNVMLTDDLCGLLIDFQFACHGPVRQRSDHFFRTISSMTYGIGHWAYSAPEIMDRFDKVYDYRADIYSLGAVLIELLVGRPPRRRPPKAWRPDIEWRLSDFLWSMVDELPGNRPTWSEIEGFFNLTPMNHGA